MWALLEAPSIAHAQPQLVPPKIARFVPAEDPRSGESPRATVELEMDVDREGAVTAVRVARSAGSALDEAAVSAARGFTFEPATRDGKPVAARIHYAYVFEAVSAPAPAPEPDAEVPNAATEPPPPVSVPDAFGATAKVEAPAREPTKRALAAEELRSVAGTRGDPLRAVELLPGVSRPAVGDGNPILRGANPVDSQVFLEGAPVPILYHLGGLTSFVHARVLESVELTPGNFSVRYGRKVGGIVEVRLRDPRMDRVHGIADVSLIDSSLVVETPLGDQVGVLAAVRRSNIDAVLNAASDTGDLSITAAPVYWDYQSVATWKPNDKDRLRLIAYGSSDRLALVIKKPSDVDPAIRGAFDQSTVFHRAQLAYRHHWSSGSEQNAELTVGRTTATGSYGPLGKSEFAVDTVQGRTEWALVLAPAARIVAGIDALANHWDGRYEGIPPMAGEGLGPTPLGTQRRVSIDASTWIVTPGAYLETGIRPIPRVLVTTGLRADYNDQIQKAAVDPRLSARWEVTDATILRGGLGRFSQAPLEQEAILPIGNPALRMTQATHASFGVEQHVGDAVTASVDGFAKRIDAIVSGTPGGRPPSFVNGQEGRIFGAEALLRLRARPDARFFGFVSYTLMRSERREQGGSWRLFDRDQPHMLSASGVYRLGRGWEVGSSFRYTSGTPYTPVASSTYEATTDLYLPRLGAPMSQRNPAFTRLDVRVEKKWSFSLWSMAVYADVQNVLNAENREGFSYSYDYARREGARGLPIFPSLGLRGEL